MNDYVRETLLIYRRWIGPMITLVIVVGATLILTRTAVAPHVTYQFF